MRFKASDALRFLAGLAVAALVLGFVVLRVTRHAPAPASFISSSAPSPTAVTGSLSPSQPAPPAPAPEHSAALSEANCGNGPEPAARANAASLQTLAWSPFGRPETGWATYAPLIGREINTSCAPGTPGFALALAQWETARHLAADGVLNATVFTALRNAIELRRPFVQVSAKGVCPEPPAPGALASATLAEDYGGKPVQLRAGALAAYRQMADAARREDPAIAADPRNLTIFSGFRSPADDDARCTRENNCDNVVRSTCSAHRTGLAMDLYVGQAPGFTPDSSAEANRAFMTTTPAYRWLVANADRFGFVPYPFEPWHWEWTGEAP